MAYTKPIYRPPCQLCSARATYELFNRFNGSAGYFCSRHAKNEVQRLEQGEQTAQRTLKALGLVP